MSDEITKIEVKDKEVRDFLERLMQRLQNTEPLMLSIANALRKHALKQYDKEEGPDGQAWPELAESTKKEREKHGTWPDGKMLNVSPGAGLYSSVQSAYGSDYAMIGTNKVYGRIHFLGGQAGRGHAATIPARPYLPVSADGDLAETAREDIVDIMRSYLKSAEI